MVGCSGSALLGLSLLPGVVAAAGGNLAGPVRIGFQKAGTVLVSLKTKGILEKQLQLKGATIQWSEFPAGLPMVEALNAGAIDIAYVGEAPPVFAQAANDSVTRYVAYDPFGPDGEGIVVQNDSKIKKLSELRGKKIAVQSGNPLPEARRCPRCLQPGFSRCLGDLGSVQCRHLRPERRASAAHQRGTGQQPRLLSGQQELCPGKS